jgi:hypothetical protein
VPDTLHRTRLARAAARLNAQSGHTKLPPLIFLTDDVRTPDPLPAIRALPRGSLVIVRSKNPQRRRELAHAAARIALSKSALIPMLSSDNPFAFAIFASNAKCGAGGSSAGGMHINPPIGSRKVSRQ